MTPETALATTTDIASWLTKEQAAAALVCSPKSIERYAKDGKLTHAKRTNPGKSPNVVYNPQDLERLRKELAHPAALLPPISTVAPKPQTVAFEPRFMNFIERFLEVVTEPRHIDEGAPPLPMYVSLTEALSITGLSANTLQVLARPEQAVIKTMPFGRGVRYRRADLEKL